MWTVFWRNDFNNVFDVTNRNPREILRNEAMYSGKRLTPQLIGVFDAGRNAFFHDVFALVVLQQVFNSPSLQGEAQIQPPQEVGLRAREVVTYVKVFQGTTMFRLKIGAYFYQKGIDGTAQAVNKSLHVFDEQWKNRFTLDSELLGKIRPKVEPSV